MMNGMGAWMFLWGILGLAVLSLAVVGGVLLVRSLTGREQVTRQLPASDVAQEELRRRYAAGEIDRETYLQRKVDLE
jgi:putative membrane protein